MEKRKLKGYVGGWVDRKSRERKEKERQRRRLKNIGLVERERGI